MNWMRTIVREVWGLFVDDGSFALLILVWVGVSAFVVPRLGVARGWAGVVLFAGLSVILMGSALRYKRFGGE